MILAKDYGLGALDYNIQRVETSLRNKYQGVIESSAFALERISLTHPNVPHSSKLDQAPKAYTIVCSGYFVEASNFKLRGFSNVP